MHRNTFTKKRKKTHTALDRDNEIVFFKGVGIQSLIGRSGGESGGAGLMNCLTFMVLINSPVVSLGCRSVCVCVCD